jgi:rhodanese-related sulfurtransferase
MDVGVRIAFVAQAVAGWLGFAEVPSDPAARAERVEALYQQARADFPDVTEARAATLVADPAGVVWVDVRPPVERAISTIPGAVPAEEIEADPAAWSGRRLVAYCTVGYRSGRWAKARAADGLQVENLAGGVLAWSWAGGAFARGDATTTEVHVYGPAWDLLAPGYTSTW